MEVIREDPLLASEMVALLGRERKVIKAKNEELEKELREEKQSHKTDTERAEAAEVSMRTLILNSNKMGEENQALRAELKQMRRSSKPRLVKKEESIDPSLPNAKDLLAQNARLHDQLERLRKECDRVRKEGETFRLACCDLRSENEELRKERDELAERLEAHTPHPVQSVGDTRVPTSGVQEETGIKQPKNMSLTKEDIAQLRTFFEYLPRLSGFVKHNLARVGLKGMVTNLQLTYDRRLLWWSQSLLYVPYSIANNHYALGFFPSHIFQNGQWVDAVSKHERQRREVFRTHNGNTIYTGTYQCDPPPPEWFERSGMLTHYITAARPFITQAMNDAGLNPPPQLYVDGVLKIKCLALRYVGFDKRIPAELHKPEHSPAGPAKRKADEAKPVPRKKARV